MLFIDIVGTNINETLTLQPHEAIGWLLLDSTAISIDEYSDNETNLQVFPNPAKNTLSISYNMNYNSSITIDILTLEGKAIVSYSNNLIKQGKQIQTINIENLKTGIYLIRLSTEKNILAKKLIVLQ